MTSKTSDAELLANQKQRRHKLRGSPCTLYSRAVNHFVILFLLAVLPLQMSWAVGLGHCPQNPSYAAGAAPIDATSHAIASQPQDDEAPPHGDDGHAHDHPGNGAGHAAGAGLDCSVFQFVALEPPTAGAPSMPRTCATALCGERAAYESHIPTGPERPKWHLAA
jgi:hypothetical protein